jgi:hypothetical protein
VDPARGVAGEEVAKEDSVAVEAVGVVVVEAVVVVVVVAVEEGEANRQQQQQQQQPPTHLEMDSKEYHPPFSEEIPRCLIHLSRNGNYIEPPMSIMTT